MKFAMCNEFCQGWSVDDALRLAAEVGYDGVEIAPFTLADDARAVSTAERERLRRSAADRGVAIIGLHWLLVKPPGLSITGPDAAVRRQTLEYLEALVDLCADLGGDRIVLGSPKQRMVLPGTTPAEAWERARDLFVALMPRAASRRVTVCLEPLARTETNFINTVAEGLRMVAAVDHPCFKVHLDVKAMSDEPRPFDVVIGEAAGQVGHLHVNDANRGGPGSGATDYGPIVRGLAGIGYDDWASVEVFDFAPGPETIARASLEFLKRVFVSPSTPA